jgi:predicted naringenin-chalcone synthase
MIHTGSLKILDGFKGLFNLQDSQIKESYETLNQYGNLTGVSIPTVMYKAFGKNQGITGNGVLIGITMGFGLDIVEVEKF